MKKKLERKKVEWAEIIFLSIFLVKIKFLLTIDVVMLKPYSQGPLPIVPKVQNPLSRKHLPH